MVSDDGTSNSNDLGADVDEKVGGLARIVGDIFSTDSAMTESSKLMLISNQPVCFLVVEEIMQSQLIFLHKY